MLNPYIYKLEGAQTAIYLFELRGFEIDIIDRILALDTATNFDILKFLVTHVSSNFASH